MRATEHAQRVRVTQLRTRVGFEQRPRRSALFDVLRHAFAKVAVQRRAQGFAAQTLATERRRQLLLRVVQAGGPQGVRTASLWSAGTPSTSAIFSQYQSGQSMTPSA